jgi:hypothetical protein
MKFKAGDKVRCKADYWEQFTAGKVYTVKSHAPGSSMVNVERDDRGSTENGWGQEHFEIVTPDSKDVLEVGDSLVYIPETRLTVTAIRTMRAGKPGLWIDGVLPGGVEIRDWDGQN